MSFKLAKTGVIPFDTFRINGYNFNRHWGIV